MAELLLFQHSGTRFGIWRSQFKRVTEVPRITRLGVNSIHVVALVEGTIGYLVDLGACLGMLGDTVGSQDYALLLDGEEGVTGFWFAGRIDSRDVRREDVHLFPPRIRQKLIKTAAMIDGRLVPIVEALPMLNSSSSEDVEPIVLKGKRGGTAIGASGSYVTFAAGGYRFAADAELVGLGPSNPVTAVPLFHDSLAGITWVDDRIVPVVDLQYATGIEYDKEQTELLLVKGDPEFAILAASVSAETEKGAVVPLPGMFSFSWMTGALRSGAAILPVMNLSALVSSHGKQDTGTMLGYRLRSAVAEKFLSEPVIVVDITLGGVRYCIPSEEVEQIVDVSTVLEIPGRRALAKGVIALGDDLIPAVDLAGYFGTSDADGGRAIILANGTFRASIFVDTVSEERELSPDAQRPLPTQAQHPIAYGCALDGQEVSIVLDVATMAIHSAGVGIRRALNVLVEPAADAPSINPVVEETPHIQKERPPEIPEEHHIEEPAEQRAVLEEPVVEESLDGESPGGEPVNEEPVAVAPPGEDSAGEDLIVVDLAYDEIATAPNGIDERSTEEPPQSSQAMPEEILSPFEVESPANHYRKKRRLILALVLVLFALACAIVTALPATGAWLRGFINPADPELSEPVSFGATISVDDSPSAGDLSVLTVKTIYFSADVAEITPQADRVLREIADLACSQPELYIAITGHTANFGSEESCLALSSQRAANVRNALLERSAIDERHLTSRGVGTAQPVVDESDPDEVHLNRRVEIELAVEGG